MYLEIEVVHSDLSPADSIYNLPLLHGTNGSGKRSFYIDSHVGKNKSQIHLSQMSMCVHGKFKKKFSFYYSETANVQN